MKIHYKIAVKLLVFIGIVVFVCSLAYSADVMRRNMSVISGETSTDYSTYTDTATGFVVSKCAGDYNPKEKLGISYDANNHLMNTNLPSCATDKKYSGACWVEYNGFDGDAYRVKICHVGSGYKDDSKCVYLPPNSKNGEFSTKEIRTFGFGDEEYSGGFLNGDIDCPDLTNNINGNGYGFVYEATNPKYKDFADYYNQYCEPLILQNTPAHCDNEGKCPCNQDCREHGFMPNPASDYWRKEISDEVKICYHCNKRIRAISYYCEKIYKCINKHQSSEAYQLLSNRNKRPTLKKLYGKGHYLCGYYNNALCGCAKLQLVGGPRHFSRIARVDNLSTHNCASTTTTQSPQCNMFEEQLKVRQFYDSKYVDTNETCPESHNAELGIEYRGSFFFPKIVVVAGKNERIIGYSDHSKLMNNPVFYYNTPIIGIHSTPDRESEYGISSTNSLYVSNFYPEIFTIGGTYSMKETNDTCTIQPTGEIFFVVLRLEYNIATGLSQLVAYSIKPIKTIPVDRLKAKVDGSISKFYMDREVNVASTGTKTKLIDDFDYNYDTNKDIASKKLTDSYPIGTYPYLEFTKIGSVNRPPLMYGYVNDNHLSSPLTLRHDYNAMLGSGSDRSEKVKIALNPSNLSAVEGTDTTIEQTLPMVDQSLKIRSANATAYQDTTGDVKYQGTGISNRALLYMQSFTVDYVNPCAILQNFTDLPYSKYLKEPVDNISYCNTRINYKEKLACYTTYQLIKECNAYENCLLDDRSMAECQSKKTLPIQITSSSSDDLWDYQANKDWRSKPKICIIGGFDFAEHTGDLPNTKKFGYFGNPIYDYTIALKRQKRSLFPSIDTIPLTRLGKAKSPTMIGNEQINNKYIINTPAEYFHAMKNEQYYEILNSLRNSYVFSLTTFQDTDVSLLKNYFGNCGEMNKDENGNAVGTENCANLFEVRNRKVDEVLGELCTDGDSNFGGGGWSDLNPRDLGVDYDVYIPYRCQYVDFTGTGAGGAGFTTDDMQAPCIQAYGVNAIYETCKKIIFVKLCACPISWDIKVFPMYDATGGGGGSIHGIVDLNNIDIFDGYLQLKAGEATTNTRHTVHTLKSGGRWCYVGTSEHVNILNGGHGKNSDWTVVGGSHKYWYRDLNSYGNGNYDTDDIKGNTIIGYRKYSLIGTTDAALTAARADEIAIANAENSISSSTSNICLTEKNKLLNNGYSEEDIDFLETYREQCQLEQVQNEASGESFDASMCATTATTTTATTATTTSVTDPTTIVKCDIITQDMEARKERIRARRELTQAENDYNTISSKENLAKVNEAQSKLNDLNSKTLPLDELRSQHLSDSNVVDYIDNITTNLNDQERDEDNFLNSNNNDCSDEPLIPEGSSVPSSSGFEMCCAVDVMEKYQTCWNNNTRECYTDANRTIFNVSKENLPKCKKEKAKKILKDIRMKYPMSQDPNTAECYTDDTRTVFDTSKETVSSNVTAETVLKCKKEKAQRYSISIKQIKKKISSIISQYEQPTDTNIATAERGGSPIDYRIANSGDGPYIEGGGKYTQKQVCANPWHSYLRWALGANGGYTPWCLVKGSGPTIFGAVHKKPSDIHLIEYIDDNDLYKNRDNTKGKYLYNATLFIDVSGDEGHGSRLSKEESSEGNLGGATHAYNKNHTGFRNDLSDLSGKPIGGTGDGVLTDNYYYHQFNEFEKGTGGPFIHRKGAGGGTEGTLSLSLSPIKIKYEQDALTKAEYPKMDANGRKEREIGGVNTDTSCAVRCPPLYRYMRDKRFVFPDGDIAQLDVVCEYAGTPETDMEVPNGTDVTPKKCYITSHYIHTEYGDVYGKIIRNDKYCPLVKCANGSFGFSGHTATGDEKQRWQYDRKAMMCKYPDGSRVSFDGGATTQAGKSAYYLSMMFDKNIYAGMSYESMQLNDYYTYFRGNSYKLASCARNDVKYYINDDFEMMEGWILKCGNGFWQLPDEIDPPIKIYEKPSSTPAGYPYEDESRDMHYTGNNRPMWYTDWIIFDHSYEINGVKTSGIKKFDRDYLGVGGTDIKTKRLALKAYCPPIDATTYDFDVDYSGNANWEAVEENSNEVEATSCAGGDRTSFKNGTALPRRRCMRNGMWGPVLNPCSRGCIEETDRATGIFWSMANMDHTIGVGADGKATINGVCNGGLYLNSADAPSSSSMTTTPTRKCNVATATWDPAPSGHKCSDDLICMADGNIGQVYVPYIRVIDNSQLSVKYFTDIAKAIKNGTYNLKDATKVNDNSYFIFNTLKETSLLGFSYYQADNSYINVAGQTLNVNDVNKITDTDGNQLIDTSSDSVMNYYIIKINNTFTTPQMSYIMARDEERNEFLNVYRWLMDLQYPERNYTGEWSYKCNLSMKNSSLSSNASKMTTIQERYKNTTLSVYIPLISNNDMNIKRIAIFSPNLALSFASENGYTNPVARRIIADNTNIKFRIPLQLSGALRYKNGNSTLLTNYPNDILDDYPMILYNGFDKNRVYSFENSLTEKNKIWQTTAPVKTPSTRDCNGVYTGYIKHNTLKHIMYSETPVSEKVHFISAYCYNGHIFGYYGIDAVFAQDQARTIIPNDDNVNNTPLCFLSNFITTLPADINAFILSKYPNLQNTNLYPLQKNSYIMAMLIQYWKTYLQPQKEDKEYFIENSIQVTASADAKINNIHKEYKASTRSKYFRIVPRRVDWIIASDKHNDDFTEPTNKDYGKLNTDDPYCEKTECRNQITTSNTFNRTIADVHRVWSVCSAI